MTVTASWPKIPLGEVCEFKYGKSLPEHARIPGPYLVYGSNGTVGTHQTTLTRGPAIIIGRKGSFGEVHYSDAPCWPIDTTYYIDSTSTTCDLKWLSYRLTHLCLKSLNRAAAVPGLNREDAYRQEFLLPSLDEQRHIVHILDSANALRAKRREAVALLDGLTQSIFLDIFGDPTAIQPMSPLLPLADIVARPLQNGAYYPKELYNSAHGTEMVHMSDAFYGQVSRGTLKRVNCSESDRKKYALDAGDLLVARRSLNYEGSVKPCLIPSSREPLIFESSLIRVTPDQETVSTTYLYHYLSNRRVRQRFVFPFVTGATISGISQKNLGSVLVMTPPVEEQLRFAGRIAVLEQVRANYESHLVELDALYVSLQHRAFRGELWADSPAA